MWKDKLKEIIEIMNTFKEKINNGALEEEIRALMTKAEEELNIVLPEEYIEVLKVVNGLEFNGHILYGIDEELLREVPNQLINGLIDSNKIWYENEWQKQYIFLGESSISWYVYDLATKKYWELDNPSGRECEEFVDFYSLLEKLLSDSLL